MANTKAGVPLIHDSAERHRGSAADFTTANQNIQSEVDGLVATNRGDLFNKLNVLQDEWSADVNNIIQQVTDMAGYLDWAADSIQNQDAGSGSGLN